jgi:hypothetical protein
MADLDDVLIFVKLAQFESISRAARSLGVPISTVSRRLSVAGVEARRVAPEAHKRRVTLTAQGREYFNHTHSEWLKFMPKINRETPKGKTLHLIADNYATHKHPAVQDWLAKQPRFD